MRGLLPAQTCMSMQTLKCLQRRVADRCVYMSAPVCMYMYDWWADRKRPQIRAQTNWVINESDGGAAMGPTLPISWCMPTSGYGHLYSRNKENCQRGEETMFRRKGLPTTPVSSPNLCFYTWETHPHTPVSAGSAREQSGGSGVLM